MNSLLVSDGYKQSHKEQHPTGTSLVYSNWTPRSRKYAIGKTNGVVVFGIQAFIKKVLMEDLNQNFFHRPLSEVKKSFIRRMTNYLGSTPDASHIEDLHRLGYLLLLRRSPKVVFVRLVYPC